MPENHMAAALLIQFVSQLLEYLNSLTAGNDRQFHPPETSITSSDMLGGTGSPCFIRLLI